MKLIEKYNKNILKNWLIQSGVVCLILYIVSLIVSATATLFWGIFLLILIIPTYLIGIFGLTIFKKDRHKACVAINIFEFIYVYLIQLIVCGFLTIVISYIMTLEIDSVRMYKSALRQTMCKECIQHFPKHVPWQARQVIFHKDKHPLFGSVEVRLSFNAKKKYIDKELAKYQFVKIEGPFKDAQEYDYSVKYLEACCEGIPVHGTKNYIIKSSSINEDEPFQGPYAYGILVDEKKNRITYYYIAPD